MSVEFPHGSPVATTHPVHVQVTFHTTDERAARTVAAKLIDRAHEIANLPECECDVDVSVESPSLEAPPSMDLSGAPPSTHPSRS